jgi:hypothetical protein
MPDTDLTQLTNIVTSVITDSNVAQTVASIQLVKQQIAELQQQLLELEASLPTVVANAINPSVESTEETNL